MKLTRFVKGLALAIVPLALAACASIFSGSSQEVTFHSTPEGATVVLSGKTLGLTPLTTSLKREKGQALSLEKDGYKPFTARLETHLNSWFWGNIVIGGVFGSTTDAASGAMYEYSPSQYMVMMEQVGTGQAGGQVTRPKAQKAREFLVVAYSNILSDIASGGGPHFSSLMHLLLIPDDQAADARSKIAALAQVYTDIPDFADHVIALYFKGDE